MQPDSGLVFGLQTDGLAPKQTSRGGGNPPAKDQSVSVSTLECANSRTLAHAHVENVAMGSPSDRRNQNQNQTDAAMLEVSGDVTTSRR